MHPEEAQDNEIHRALLELQQSPEEGASVLIIDPTSRRAVLFATTTPGEIQFSFARPLTDESNEKLPGQELFITSDEEVRLRSFLKHRQIEYVCALMPYPTENGKTQLSLIEGPLDDPANGKDFVDAIFTEVYELDAPAEVTILIE